MRTRPSARSDAWNSLLFVACPRTHLLRDIIREFESECRLMNHLLQHRNRLPRNWGVSICKVMLVHLWNYRASARKHREQCSQFTHRANETIDVLRFCREQNRLRFQIPEIDAKWRCSAPLMRRKRAILCHHKEREREGKRANWVGRISDGLEGRSSVFMACFLDMTISNYTIYA